MFECWKDLNGGCLSVWQDWISRHIFTLPPSIQRPQDTALNRHRHIFTLPPLFSRLETANSKVDWFRASHFFSWHRSPKRPKTVLSGGRLREMTWWSQTNFFRDHSYHCYGFYLNRLDTPSSFSLISENQLIFRFWAIFDTKFSRYHQFEGTSSLSSVFVQLNSGSIMKKL